jgi:2-polyprenyl-3-methyl-5-hydroxy-6-metoxy-1,4-benzoquinol methylase
VSARATLGSWMRRLGALEATASSPETESATPSLARTVDITSVIDEVLPAMLKSPGESALNAIAAALSAYGQRVTGSEIRTLVCRQPVAGAFDRLFEDPVGRVVLEETNRLIALLPSYEPSRVDNHNEAFSREFFANYLRQSAFRVLRLVEELGAAAMTSGTVLEVGALFGQFAAALKRLGYDVTVVDRYKSQNGAFDRYVRYLRDIGIQVVEAERSTEAAMTAALGHFDAVISMAVVEHIPHTPREFLAMLASHVRPGGVLAIDTPNIARFWNRRYLNEGRSIHQDLATQFFCAIPYEGHHREYTAAEVVWMLEQTGCRDVRTSLYDYNILQFGELAGDHLDALLTMTVDPTYADMILAIGRVPHD